MAIGPTGLLFKRDIVAEAVKQVTDGVILNTGVVIIACIADALLVKKPPVSL